VRLLVAPAQQVGRRPFDPPGIDGRYGAGVDPGGLHDLRRHHPGGIAAEDAGAGKDMEAQAPGPEVVLALRAQPQLAQQAWEQGLVDPFRGGILTTEAPAQALHCQAELAM